MKNLLEVQVIYSYGKKNPYCPLIFRQIAFSSAKSKITQPLGILNLSS